MSGRRHARHVHAESLLAMSGGDAVPTHDQIAARAFELWEARGRPLGDDQGDWYEAERQLRAHGPAMRKDVATHSGPAWAGPPRPGPATTAEQTREARESEAARRAGPSNRERMVDIGRGNQQAGRQDR
jgi:hypothetical protein